MKKINYLKLEDIQAISDVVVKINEIIGQVNELQNEIVTNGFNNTYNEVVSLFTKLK